MLKHLIIHVFTTFLVHLTSLFQDTYPIVKLQHELFLESVRKCSSATFAKENHPFCLELLKHPNPDFYMEWIKKSFNGFQAWDESFTKKFLFITVFVYIIVEGPLFIRKIFK
jgi:hypothetical protein